MFHSHKETFIYYKFFTFILQSEKTFFNVRQEVTRFLRCQKDTDLFAFSYKNAMPVRQVFSSCSKTKSTLLTLIMLRGGVKLSFLCKFAKQIEYCL